MKVIHPICAGIDIHKKSFTVALNVTKANGTYSVKTKTFSTMQSGIISSRDWLIETNCIDVAMESTGKYWIPVFNLFEGFFNLTLANPRITKTFPGNKTDPRDARWLSELHRIGLVAPSFIPPKDIRELRELTRYRTKLIKMRTAEKNRIQNSLIVCNIMISSVATDTFGKSGMAITTLSLTKKLPKSNLLLMIKQGHTNALLIFYALYQELKKLQQLLLLPKLALICPNSTLLTIFAHGPELVLKTIKVPGRENLSEPYPGHYLLLFFILSKSKSHLESNHKNSAFQSRRNKS